MALTSTDGFNLGSGGFDFNSPNRDYIFEEKGSSRIDIVSDANRASTNIHKDLSYTYDTFRHEEPSVQPSTMKAYNSNSPAIQKGSLPSYSVTTDYFNYSNKNLYVVDGNRPAVRIGTVETSIMSKEVFAIRKTYYFATPGAFTEMIKDAEAYIAINHKTMSYEFAEFMATAKKALNFGVGDIVEMKFDYVYNFDAIKERQIYVTELDSVFSLTPNVYHPRDSNSKITGILNDLESGHGYEGFLIEIVDNEGIHNSRYFNFGGEAREIKSVRDLTRPSGVYSIDVSTRAGKSKMKRTYMSTEEAEKAQRVFRTKEDALYKGDEKTKAELEHRRKLTDFENEKINAEKLREEQRYMFREVAEGQKRTMLEWEAAHKQRVAEEEAAQKRHIAELDAMLKRRLLESEAEQKYRLTDYESHQKKKSMERSDYYEDRSYRRKDSSESFKSFHVFAAAAAGLVAGLGTYLIKK